MSLACDEVGQRTFGRRQAAPPGLAVRFLVAPFKSRHATRRSPLSSATVPRPRPHRGVPAPGRTICTSRPSCAAPRPPSPAARPRPSGGSPVPVSWLSSGPHSRPSRTCTASPPRRRQLDVVDAAMPAQDAPLMVASFGLDADVHPLPCGRCDACVGQPEVGDISSPACLLVVGRDARHHRTPAGVQHMRGWLVGVPDGRRRSADQPPATSRIRLAGQAGCMARTLVIAVSIDGRPLYWRAGAPSSAGRGGVEEVEPGGSGFVVGGSCPTSNKK